MKYHEITIRRVYDPPVEQEGMHVLIDRLWPRGMSKERLQIDRWMKEVAPSPELRIWFGHRAERFEEFSLRYIEQLRTESVHAYIDQLLHIAEQSPLTLLYAAKDPVHNHAVVLKRFLEGEILQQKSSLYD